MSETTLTVTGLKETQRILYSYSQQLGDRVIRGALRQGANYVLKGIKDGIPTKTGLLKKRGFRVANSKIHNGKLSTSMIGLYISLRKKKGDPFYGRFQNDGWNTHGVKKTLDNTMGRYTRHGKLKFSRGETKNRSTLPGKTNVPGKQFVQRGFESRKMAAVQLIIKSAESGAEVVKRKLGMR